MPAATAGTVREALSAATDALAAAGTDSPRLDAELLLAEALGADRAMLAADPDLGVPPEAGRVFGRMVRRRVAREPVAYIVGRKGFRRIELAVDSRVLIPRPETELLVEVALELEPRTVLDVGTGSGAVALAIADEIPGVEVTGTDSSSAALEVARANADRLGLGAKVRLLEGAMIDGGDAAAIGLLVANLPYVSEAEWERLAPEIRDFEPRQALVAGPGGLEAIEALLQLLANAPEKPGAIALEVGAGQAGPVAELVAAAGFGAVERRADLAGIERVVLGRS